MLSRNGNILIKKLHSMRETPQTSCMKKTTRQNPYGTRKSSFGLHGTPMPGSLTLCHVTRSLTRGQYAWFSSYEEHDTEQRTSRQRLSRQKTPPTSVSMESHQRLNVEKHSRDWYEHWLVGLTDGDGSFSIDRQVKPHGKIVWNLVYKISLSQYNTRALMKAKQILGAGHVTKTQDTMITLRIRDRDLLERCVFPIFDRIPLVSNKHYDYVRVREIARLLKDETLSTTQRDERIDSLWSQNMSRTALAPIWSHLISDLRDSSDEKSFEDDLLSNDNSGFRTCPKKELSPSLDRAQVTRILSVPWVSGFLEAEGSFYITCKDKDTGRYCHGFGLTQTGNGVLLQALRVFFKIGAKVRLRKPASFAHLKPESRSFYALDTTNWRTLEFLKGIMAHTFLGIKSQEFRVWERSMKHRGNNEKLRDIQSLMRSMRKKWKDSDIFVETSFDSSGFLF